MLALMTIQPEKVTGCAMAKDWYKKDETTVRGYIDCVAGKIRQNKPFEDLVKTLAGTDAQYQPKVIAAKNKWEQTKINAG